MQHRLLLTVVAEPFCFVLGNRVLKSFAEIPKRRQTVFRPARPVPRGIPGNDSQMMLRHKGLDNGAFGLCGRASGKMRISRFTLYS